MHLPDTCVAAVYVMKLSPIFVGKLNLVCFYANNIFNISTSWCWSKWQMECIFCFTFNSEIICISHSAQKLVHSEKQMQIHTDFTPAKKFTGLLNPFHHQNRQNLTRYGPRLVIPKDGPSVHWAIHMDPQWLFLDNQTGIQASHNTSTLRTLTWKSLHRRGSWDQVYRVE